MLKGKKIVVGITGGIAAYKSAELVREFIRRGAYVRVIMTKNATEFITPLTLQTLSENPVFCDMFSPIRESEIAHISLAEYADIMVIAPATANIIGKIASGIADNLLTTTVIATKAPVLICPAMNANMYTNAIVKENIEKLASRGYLFIEPAYGELACKSEGTGRLAEVSEIVEEVESILTVKDLRGERILITAGPTREPFDPVRYMTNCSSGKMGYALAQMARRRGAEVTLISGPSSLPVPRGVKFIPISSAVEMRDAVMKNLEASNVIIKTAAVADYRPAVYSSSKIKKQDGPLAISLEKNPDIISEVGKKKGRRILVGFAMESENLIENAKVKMLEKNMDFIIANDVTKEGAGFQSDTNIVKILSRDGEIEDLPMMDKTEVADRILDRVKKMIVRSCRL
ncbi:MAG: bifunctional phosphopantothenoylcysteine decarboxylase/phosphopantothenate--cysteine ligase CoaBC [Syntrophales bacterium]|nr:bifunctional phosphopantothenoylcysteine decarboxylase/phosphopantothenate--cysteine ligase CoaBC [Syntrophales bacterium]